MDEQNDNGAEERQTYTTSRGYEVEFVSIPQLMAKLVAQFPEPSPPTYTVTVAGGGKETHTHDETTLETEADKRAWAEYRAAVNKRTADLFQAQLRLCLLRGIRVRNADAADLQAQWIAEQELIGFVIPTEPSARHLHWLETEVVSDSEDFIQILAGVSRVSGIQEEVVSNLEVTFRSAMGRQRRNGAAGPQAARNGQAVVADLPIRTNGRGGQKRHPKTERVGRAVSRR